HHKFFVRLHTGKKSVTYSGGCACGVDPGNEVFFSMNFSSVNVPSLNGSSDDTTSSQQPTVSDEPDASNQPTDSSRPDAPAEPIQHSYDWVGALAVCVLLLIMLYVFLRKRR
ncbi:MAG: hypothetical protein IJY28_05385, partial [Clostridia bacterium]|nr:hypothetical protein [Clostridia bacterium]